LVWKVEQARVCHYLYQNFGGQTTRQSKHFLFFDVPSESRGLIGDSDGVKFSLSGPGLHIAGPTAAAGAHGLCEHISLRHIISH